MKKGLLAFLLLNEFLCASHGSKQTLNVSSWTYTQRSFPISGPKDIFIKTIAGGRVSIRGTSSLNDFVSFSVTSTPSRLPEIISVGTLNIDDSEDLLQIEVTNGKRVPIDVTVEIPERLLKSLAIRARYVQIRGFAQPLSTIRTVFLDLGMKASAELGIYGLDAPGGIVVSAPSWQEEGRLDIRNLSSRSQLLLNEAPLDCQKALLADPIILALPKEKLKGIWALVDPT